MTDATLYTSRESAKFALASLSARELETVRLIECSFRAPARYASLLIPGGPWQQLAASVPNAQYRTLLEAVLDSAAKRILSTRIENYSIFPSEIDTSIFTSDAILSEAIGGNSDWISKDELTALWEQSATRRKYTSSPRYTSDAQYRRTANMFTDLVLKLSGKTTVMPPELCDKLLAKLEPSDIDTELGAFIVRRLEAIRNRPQRNEIDIDSL